ncbi:hypothetical protein ACVWZX_004025 [Deinococcus sp. UYEF24]
MDVEVAHLLPSRNGMLHYRAEALTFTHIPDVYPLGLWDDLSLAQKRCREHDNTAPPLALAWQRRYNGLWEAQGKTHRYQIVLMLGPLA